MLCRESVLLSPRHKQMGVGGGEGRGGWWGLSEVNVARCLLPPPCAHTCILTKFRPKEGDHPYLDIILTLSSFVSISNVVYMMIFEQHI